ncbi:hypothetical protein BGZ83_010684 [Gryganskiella cystojenkinii]|nr:hypothetical protein BGZ83_010684 [Gryganskiella cystojenkinii]
MSTHAANISDSDTTAHADAAAASLRHSDTLLFNTAPPLPPPAPSLSDTAAITNTESPSIIQPSGQDQSQEAGASASLHSMPISPDNNTVVDTQLIQKMTILHPALASTAVPPSNVAPTIYALASTVPFPTVNQLTMNITNQPVVQEQVAVPFKTILCSPPTQSAGTTSPPTEHDIQAAAIAAAEFRDPQRLDLQQNRTVMDWTKSSQRRLDEAVDIDPPTATTTNPFEPVYPQENPEKQREQQHHQQQSEQQQYQQQPRADERNNSEVHPYFAAANFPGRPSTLRRQYSTSEVSLSSSRPPPPLTTGPDQLNSSVVPPPQPSTSFFTPSSNSDTVPVHHAVHDTNLDPGMAKRRADERERAREAETAASGGNNAIGSRTTVFGFAPLYNQGDHQASMLSSEERVLKESLVCRTMPLSGRPHLSRNSSSSRHTVSPGSSPAGQEESYQSPMQPSVTTTAVIDGDPQAAVPHARAGISPTLNLDQIEAGGIEFTISETEESVESLIETKDWSKTGLGPRSSWPPELNMLMPLLQKSASPLAIYWGDQSYLIYNDAWRPILKLKHPLAMGMPGAMVWSEIWDELSAQMEQVRQSGRGKDNKGLREGYEEECYFDFTFSPIFLQDGSIGGILAFVQEVTQSILNQRRLATLNQFSKQAPLIQSVTGAYSMITTILQESNNLDIPFSIVYKTKDLTKDPATTQTTQGTFSPPPCQLMPSPVMSGSSHDDLLSTGNHTGTSTITAGLGLETMVDFENFDNESSSLKSKVQLIHSHFSAGLFSGKKDARRAPQAAILCSTSFDRNLEVVDYGCSNEKIFSKATSTRHIPDSLLITPEEYEPLDPTAPVYDDPWAWPVRSVLADGVPRLVTLPKSTHKLARAILLPILENPSVLDSRITTVLIVGINPFQMLDNQYLDFLALLVANIASLLHFGRSREEERKSTEALFELNKAKISFFQNISHELRTPLTLMLAPLDDVLSQTPEKAPTRASLEMIRRNSRRLLKLVNTLLQFSRIEAGKGLAIFEETDLTKATREISANFESVARGFKLDYVVNCEDLNDVPGGIWVDRAMWGGIILNLIGNALKHTWTGSVTIHQYPSKGKNGRDGVAVDVIDTGVGISAENLHSLFGRFNRIENKQSRSHEGTGIGLSLVKELTEVHGGNVSVTSEVDKGTCFHLWIPAGRAHHPSAQIKVGDSNENEWNTLALRGSQSEILNNKTDPSMYIEEATQWISQKSLPGSTLTASGTDSTEEEKQEDDDDAIHQGLEYMRDRQDSVEVNQEFEVSTLEMEEEEFSKILIDPPEEGELTAQDSNDLSKTSRRSSGSIDSPKIPKAPIFANLAFREETPSVNSRPASEDMLEMSVSNDGGFGEQIQPEEIVDDPETEKTALPRARSRRSFIIIVDDNNDMRAYLREILGKDFRVRCAVDGLDAIRLISERLHQGKRIDLVLSDVAMPNMNGYELLKRLRSDPATMMTPFILLSARAGEEANVEGLDLGADDCLVKPFSARELLARVRSTIRLSDLRHELIREQRHALEMKQLIYSISVRIRSGLSLPQILDTASRELFKVIRCNAIRICRFRRVDPESGQHWVRFVSEIVRVGKPKILTPTDRLLPKGLEINEIHPPSDGTDMELMGGDLRHVTNYQHPVYGAKSFISVALVYNSKIWGYLLASRDADMVDWSQSEKLLFEQTGNQISLAIAHASLWELKKSQQVEMEAAHAANEAKSQILANTSHELRTPIGAIVGALSALEDTDYNLTGEQRDMVKIMQITSDVALSVINDLLDTAKLEAGAMSLTIKECPGLVDTLEQSVRIFADKAGRKEVDLVLEPSEELESFETLIQQGAMIWTDGDRLQQVIMNLIGNAVKFTASGKVVIQCSFTKGMTGPVHGLGAGVSSAAGSSASSPIISSFGDNGLDGHGSSSMSSSNHTPTMSPHPKIHHPVPIPPDAQVTQGTLRFEVSDTGIGIDPEFLKNHIFKSFAQYDQSMTRRFGGTGLGLAISKHLVMMNGGILGVTSNVGQGSTFYFTWPIALVSTFKGLNSPSRPLPARPVLSSELAFETRAVVVEPVPEARNMIGWILSQQSIEVTLYENCDNVVKDEQERKPDLLGPDGSVLVANYRPNAHFFFCTRSTTAEATIQTARALGELFKAKNTAERLKETQDHRDLIVSIVLVVFSSPQGRSLAKDMIKRIRANGLEQTVLCRYVVKPVKTERVVECLQMQGSYAPFIRGMTENSPEAVQANALQHRHNHDHHPYRPHHHHRQSNGHASEVIRSDGEMTPGDYDKDDYCNKNTEYLNGSQSPSVEANPLGRSLYQQSVMFSPGASGAATPLGSSSSSSTASTSTAPTTTTILKTPPTSSSSSSHARSSAATQRRLRLRSTTENGAISGRHGKNLKTSGAQSTDESVKSSSDNPAFSNRAARAAAGKRERRGKCILCVEDNIINLRVVQYQLQKLGYDTQSACDGQVAVDIIKAQIEMHGQGTTSEGENGQSDGATNTVTEATAADTTPRVISTGADTDAADTETDGDITAASADDEATGSRHPLSIEKGLLVIIPESNGNKSHTFYSTDQGVPLPSVATTVEEDTSISSALLSSSTTSLDQPALPEESGQSNATTPAVSPLVSVLNPSAGQQYSSHSVTPQSSKRSPKSSSGKNLLTQAPNHHRSNAGATPKIDLILMDCAMPVKSGFDAASEIRAMGMKSKFAASIPIIALTASAVASTREKCIAAGMNGYLSKPTKLADLEAMLDQWIE